MTTKLRTGRKKVLLALDWIEPAQLQGIYRYACDANWILSRWLPGQRNWLETFQPDGIICQMCADDPGIVAEVRAARLRLMAELRAARLPMVELFGHRKSLPMPKVLPDSKAIGALAAEHLMAQGFKRLLFMGVEKHEHPLNHQYYQGFTDAVARAGSECVTCFIDRPEIQRAVGEDRPHSQIIHDECSLARQKWAGRYFGATAKPIGVFIENFVTAFDYVEGAVAADILIPEQMGVVSIFPDEYEGSAFIVPTTGVLKNHEVQTYEAARLLDRMMHGGRIPPETVLLVPPTLIKRRSTQVYAVDDVNVSRATQYIMQHLHQPTISTSRVCFEIGIARSTLHTSFRKSMGKSIAEYVEHLRITEAIQLLTGTDVTAGDIAMQCGFTDLKHFRRALKRHTGLIPSVYRARHQQPSS